MNNRDSAAVTAQVLKALADTGNRAVLMAGWGGLSASVESRDVHMVENVPHDWLFPRIAAGGHHATSVALHARQLSIDHPTRGERLEFTAAPPSLGIWDWARSSA